MRLQITSQGRVDGGFSVGENDDRVRSCPFVIAHELLRLDSLVRSEVVGPAVPGSPNISRDFSEFLLDVRILRRDL